MQAHLRLKAWRRSVGVTQKALAEAAGISQSALSLIEAGGRDPSLEQAHRLAIATCGALQPRVWLTRARLSSARRLATTEDTVRTTSTGAN